MQCFSADAKGQLNSEWIFQVIINPSFVPECQPKILKISALINFQARNP